jgi:uncharacterized membrane protein (UPF0127 family)
VSRALALGVALAMISCGAGPGPKEAPSSAPRVIVETASGAHAVTVELARTDAERAMGLMHRRALAEDAGMLFVFRESDDHSFWMRNTLIPLDMIFIGEDGRVVGVIERAEPLTLTQRSIGKPSRYVLEVNGGWCAKRGVRAGDRVRFEGVL